MLGHLSVAQLKAAVRGGLRRPSLHAAIAAAVVCVVLQPAAAATTERDLAVMVRAVGFVEGFPKGDVAAAVVDGPGADAVMAAFGSGVSGGAVTLKPKKLAVGELAGSGVKVIIVPEGQSGQHAAIAAAAKQLKAVTISTDKGCAQAGQCVLSATSAPQVEIVMSRSAASAAGVSFGAAFRVMIKEI